MTKGSRAGAMVLSARFLAWARSNGHEKLILEIEIAQGDYKRTGADTSRYEKLSDKELTERREAAISRVNRLTAEATRRGDVDGEIPAAASSG